MSDLSNTIYDYYFKQFNSLPAKEQFHLASRLYLWDQDTNCSDKLEGLKAWFTDNNSPHSAVYKVQAEALKDDSLGSKNAASLREPYLKRYPNLKVYVSVLFQILFLKTVYNIDVSSVFFDMFPKQEVEQVLEHLLQDAPAIAILSTHAINFIYLYNGLILDDIEALSPGYFYDLGRKQYDLKDPVQLQLHIYLYTHCVIGESLFYYRKIPVNHLPVYRSMLKDLERLIDSHFMDVNLDNKFEFLVCCKMAGLSSALSEKIMIEASKSVSDDGNFLVDKYNLSPRRKNTSFAKSEHRNVLFLMANREFNPIETTD